MIISFSWPYIRTIFSPIFRSWSFSAAAEVNIIDKITQKYHKEERLCILEDLTLAFLQKRDWCFICRETLLKHKDEGTPVGDMKFDFPDRSLIRESVDIEMPRLRDNKTIRFDENSRFPQTAIIWVSFRMPASDLAAAVRLTLFPLSSIAMATQVQHCKREGEYQWEQQTSFIT